MSIASFHAKVDLVRYEARANGKRAALRRAWRLLLEWIASVAIRTSYPHVEWGRDAVVHGRLEMLGPGRIVIGNDCVFADGNGMPNRITVTETGATVVLGDGVILNGATIIATQSIRIGDRSLLGPCTVMDSDFHPISPDGRMSGNRSPSRPILLGDAVWVGRDAIILKGVTLGARAVVGAGTVVRQSVAEGQIVVGNPQQIAGDVRTQEG